MNQFESQCHGYMAGWQVRGSFLEEPEAEQLANLLESDPDLAQAFLAGVRRALMAGKRSTRDTAGTALTLPDDESRDHPVSLPDSMARPRPRRRRPR